MALLPLFRGQGVGKAGIKIVKVPHQWTLLLTSVTFDQSTLAGEWMTHVLYNSY